MKMKYPNTQIPASDLLFDFQKMKAKLQKAQVPKYPSTQERLGDVRTQFWVFGYLGIWVFGSFPP
jgi:hypothetical protein